MFLMFLLAMIPILWLVVALSILKMPGHKACVIAWILTAVYSLLEISGFRNGNSGTGGCAECTLANLSGYHRSVIYL